MEISYNKEKQQINLKQIKFKKGEVQVLPQGKRHQPQACDFIVMKNIRVTRVVEYSAEVKESHHGQACSREILAWRPGKPLHEALNESLYCVGVPTVLEMPELWDIS